MCARRQTISSDSGGFLASGEVPKTGRAFELGQLLHVQLQSTGDTASGEGSAPGLRHTVVATTVRHSAPQMRERVSPAGISRP